MFANAASVHETSTAELTLALILAAQRGIPDFVRAAGEGRWAPARHESLADRRVLLLGYGGVGRAIEARLAPFEVELTRVASRARDDEHGRIHGIDELPTLLPNADIVIVGVPLTERHDAASSTPRSSRRCPTAPSREHRPRQGRRHRRDPREAESGRLRFALDVTDPEPLPDGHPLFALPNVLDQPARRRRLDRDDAPHGAAAARQIERMLRGDGR